ncbi:hypothetical protein [Pedobacter sp. Leaf132]|uniref:hypothetical protein n=1 Tax=Pedobacter sp. Leaf132 TaxID=2876557 RepID=UPI001E44DE02|nr:hypothetical protein [Pedobacter sp. Leaf132]
MKKITLIFLSFILSLSNVYSQNGHKSPFRNFSAGRKLLMRIDTSVRNVHYDNKFPNQPNVSFNYLPDVNIFNIDIYFSETDRIENYRYSILEDEKPILVNQSFNRAQLKDVKMPEPYKYTSLGIFQIKGKDYYHSLI